MFSWNTFPYSDFNKVNLDWICRQISACGTFWTCSDASLVIDPDRGTGVSFYMADMTGPAGDAEPKQGDAVFYSLNGITYCAFIDDVVGAGGGNPEFLSWRIYRMTGPQGEPGSGGGTGLTEEIKQALLQLAQKVAYIDANGQTYYQDLYDALYDVEPPATLVSIDAVYTQSGTVYDTDTLDSLKTDLVVTATYSDSTTAVIPAADYTLSGSLTVGSSVITVSYSGETDTFTVTVTENPAPPVTLVSIDAVYTQSGTVYDTDTLDSLKTDLVVTANYSDSTTAVIPAADYTLSGTLTVGSSVITVSYDGQTDTFTVTVSQYVDPRTLLYNWDLTQSLTDTVSSVTMPVNSNAVQSSAGLTINSGGQAYVCAIGSNTSDIYELELEFDIGAMTKGFGNSHGRLFTLGGVPANVSTTHNVGFIWRSTGSWQIYLSSWSGDTIVSTYTDIANKTITVKIHESKMYVYDGDTLIAQSATAINNNAWMGLYIGDTSTTAYTTVITGVRVYSV